MKLNFERIEVFDDVAHTQCRIVNIKKDLADLLYKFGNGIAAHALALKIYNSQGEQEYNDEECAMIGNAAQLCTPAFIDAINTMLLGKGDEQ